MQVWDTQYELDGDRYTFNGLILYHRKNVGSDYRFEEWFRDHIAYGTIKPIISDHDSVMENRTGSEWRMENV